MGSRSKGGYKLPENDPRNSTDICKPSFSQPPKMLIVRPKGSKPKKRRRKQWKKGRGR